MAVADYFDTIQKIYIAFYQRPADPAGLKYWAQRVDAANGSLAEVIDAFANSAEAAALYGEITGETIGDIVDAIYQALFNRAPDAAGKQFYVDAFNAGEITAGKIALAVLDGSQGDDLVAINNKLAVANIFTAKVDGRPLSDAFFGTGTNFDVTYNGNDDAAAARTILAAVTSNPSTVLNESGVVAALQEKIADAGDAIGGVTSGQTFTLTAGVDSITGTGGNDTINAQAVDAAGAAKTTLSGFDVIDGGAGIDTLNIYTTGTENAVFPTAATIKNVEIVNVFNTAGAAALGDASKFEGVQQLWQNGAAAAVTNLAATTTAGFKNVDANVSVTPAAAAASVAIALDAYGENRTIAVDGSAATATLASVTVSGTVKDINSDGTVATTTLDVDTGKDVETLTVTSAVGTTLLVTDNAASAATKEVRTVDASASTGGIIFTGTVTGGTAGALATIKTGSGDDVVTITTATVKDDPVTTTVDETVSALLETGAGKDTITINTSGTGTTTVNAGDGNDTVTLTADGSGKLTVNLGAGDDTFKGAGAVVGTDVIDGGEGTDTLLLNMVGASNIGAFQNFEVFDAAALAKTLDVDILATKNTVTEFVATADVGVSAVLTNVGAGVGYRVIGDTNAANALTLTQKTAGALTITLDIDEPATTAANFVSGAKINVDAAVIASNATSVKAVFDSSFKDAAVGATDNLTNLTITGTKATALEIVSGGAFAINDLVYFSGNDATAGKGDLLTSVTISGDRAITVAITEADASEVTSINASALTGALTISTAELKAESAANTFDGGVLTLGSGSDVVTITQGAVIAGIGKGSAEDATAQGAFDVLVTGAAVQQAADVASTGTLNIKDGKFSFEGTGPATLAAAIAAVDAQLLVAGDAVVFEYIGNSYVFVNDDVGTDMVVKLAGVTGLAGLDEVGATNQLYLF